MSKTTDYFAKWREIHPVNVAERQRKRFQHLQLVTNLHAERRGEPWTDDEDQVVLTNDTRTAAILLERSYAAVVARRFRLHHGH